MVTKDQSHLSFSIVPGTRLQGVKNNDITELTVNKWSTIIKILDQKHTKPAVWIIKCNPL